MIGGRMEKILIIGCKRAMDDVCIGCSRCMVGFNRRAGEFERYDQDAELMGMLNCGDCPGSAIVTRLAQANLWNKPMNEKPTKVHIAPCITEHCPHRETIMAKIKAKAGVEVIEGTHPYMPNDIFT
jgi:predicted metal-binding protein